MNTGVSNFESLEEKDVTKYAGRWVAVVNGKVISSGDSFIFVYNESKKKYPGVRPLIGKLPEAIPIVLSSV